MKTGPPPHVTKLVKVIVPLLQCQCYCDELLEYSRMGPHEKVAELAVSSFDKFPSLLAALLVAVGNNFFSYLYIVDVFLLVSNKRQNG